MTATRGPTPTGSLRADLAFPQSDAILLIIDGIYASGTVLGPTGPARLGVPLARQLITQHTP